jgi:hypothetical protein
MRILMGTGTFGWTLLKGQWQCLAPQRVARTASSWLRSENPLPGCEPPPSRKCRNMSGTSGVGLGFTPVAANRCREKEEEVGSPSCPGLAKDGFEIFPGTAFGGAENGGGFLDGALRQQQKRQMGLLRRKPKALPRRVRLKARLAPIRNRVCPDTCGPSVSNSHYRTRCRMELPGASIWLIAMAAERLGLGAVPGHQAQKLWCGFGAYPPATSCSVPHDFARDRFDKAPF